MVPGFDDGVIRAAAAEADALILLLRVKLRTHPLPTRVSAFTPPQLLEGTDVGAPASPTREGGGWERDGGRRRGRGKERGRRAVIVKLMFMLSLIKNDGSGSKY